MILSGNSVLASAMSVGKQGKFSKSPELHSCPQLSSRTSLAFRMEVQIGSSPVALSLMNAQVISECDAHLHLVVAL